MDELYSVLHSEELEVEIRDDDQVAADLREFICADMDGLDVGVVDG